MFLKFNIVYKVYGYGMLAVTSAFKILNYNINLKIHFMSKIAHQRVQEFRATRKPDVAIGGS